MLSPRRSLGHLSVNLCNALESFLAPACGSSYNHGIPSRLAVGYQMAKIMMLIVIPMLMPHKIFDVRWEEVEGQFDIIFGMTIGGCL